MESPGISAMKTPRPTLSLCMIVKDEEERLPLCIESVRDWVDEMIVVDTGSSDQTREVAQRSGAKVFLHPWEHDFSKHRNQSISYATGDWILIMDADEELNPGDGAKLRQAIGYVQFDSIMVVVVNFYNQKRSRSVLNQVRLFQNLPEIRYSGIVHNQLSGYRKSMPCDAVIHHYGYDLNKKEMDAKFLRTTSLLRTRIQEEPENFRHYHDLAVSYSMNHQFEGAISAGIKAIDLAEKAEKKGGVLVLWTHFIVASSFLIKGEYDKAAEQSSRALKIFPDHLDSHFMLAMAFHGLKAWPGFDQACMTYFTLLERAKEAPVQGGYMVQNTVGEAWRVFLALGDSLLERGDKQKAIEAFDDASRRSPVVHECLRIAGDFLRKHSLWEEACRYYGESLKQQGDPKACYLGMGAAMSRLGRKRKAMECYEAASLFQSGGADQPRGKAHA
jgi:glycosyltransferase involved in cell wall biosynthesis